MTRRAHPFAALTALVLGLSLASCGTLPGGGSVTPDTSVAPGASKLATIRISGTLTQAALQAALPQATILSFNPEAGNAIVSIPDASGTLRASSLHVGTLGVADAVVLAVEPDVEVAVQAEEAMGGVSWAGGTVSWAGGAVSWAGGQSFLDAAAQASVTAYSKALNLPAAQARVPELGAGVKVAVIDTGVDVNHPLLKANLNLADSWDFVDRDSLPAEVSSNASNSKYGHGTAVAGIILQMAPKASIMVMRALKPTGNGATSLVVSAINKAVTNGAKVINLSLGSSSDSVALSTAISNALAKGVVVVTSSGNEGKEGMLYPANNSKSTRFAADSGLISVGSVDAKLMKSSFSNYAVNMIVNAPGEAVVTAFPDSRLVAATGTSFAAPAVSGAVALAASAGVTDVRLLAGQIGTGATANPDVTYRAKLGAGTLNVGSFVSVFR